MNFRRALANEAPALSSLALASKSHWPYSPGQLEAWRESLTISASTVSSLPTHVAEIDGEIVGFFVLLPVPGEWALEHFWVSPARMGRGVGRAMFSCAAKIASQAGAAALRVDADPHAEAFYLACGAVRVGSLSAPIEGQPQRVLPQLSLPLARSSQPPHPSHRSHFSSGTDNFQ